MSNGPNLPQNSTAPNLVDEMEAEYTSKFDDGNAVQNPQKLNIFIHRRDLRCFDNTTLNHMSTYKEGVTPIFIFTPEQIIKSKNEYFNDNLVQFMCESLESLDGEYQSKGGRLNLFEGDIIQVLESIHQYKPISSVGFNADYSPYSKIRDDKIEIWCNTKNIKFVKQEDMLLVNIMDKINYPNNKPFDVFTPFMKYQRKNYEVEKPSKQRIKLQNVDIESKFRIPTDKISKFYTHNPKLHCHGGRKMGLKCLKDLDQQQNYKQMRMNLDYRSSEMSPYLNLGIISIREAYDRTLSLYSEDHHLIFEIWWRDFYYNVMYRYPHVVGNALNKNFTNVPWDNNLEWFEKWKNGKTGFPIVDAAMVELNTTGFINNRARLIVASFLTKDLYIDWRWGEKYFANKLIDCNVSANNGGWQGCAGTGTDKQIRIFNPWLQVSRYDKNCNYVKKWLPQLKGIPNKDIHEWDKCWKKYINAIDYPAPMVDHEERREYAVRKLTPYAGQGEMGRNNNGKKGNRIPRDNKNNRKYNNNRYRV